VLALPVRSITPGAVGALPATRPNAWLGVQLERAEVGVTEEVHDEHGVSGPVLAAHCWRSGGLRLAQELALTRVTAFDGGDAAQLRRWQKPAVHTGYGFVRMLYEPCRGHHI